MKFILTFLILLVLALGGMIALANHDTAARANLAFKQYAPVTATFSRLRGDRHHVLSVYYRLEFEGKKPPFREAVAAWSLRPFRLVTFITK